MESKLGDVNNDLKAAQVYLEDANKEWRNIMRTIEKDSLRYKNWSNWLKNLYMAYWEAQQDLKEAQSKFERGEIEKEEYLKQVKATKEMEMMFNLAQRVESLRDAVYSEAINTLVQIFETPEALKLLEKGGMIDTVRDKMREIIDKT